MRFSQWRATPRCRQVIEPGVSAAMGNSSSRWITKAEPALKTYKLGVSSHLLPRPFSINVQSQSVLAPVKGLFCILLFLTLKPFGSKLFTGTLSSPDSSCICSTAQGAVRVICMVHEFSCHSCRKQHEKEGVS